MDGLRIVVMCPERINNIFKFWPSIDRGEDKEWTSDALSLHVGCLWRYGTRDLTKEKADLPF